MLSPYMYECARVHAQGTKINNYTCAQRSSYLINSSITADVTSPPLCTLVDWWAQLIQVIISWNNNNPCI